MGGYAPSLASTAVSFGGVWQQKRREKVVLDRLQKPTLSSYHKTHLPSHHVFRVAEPDYSNARYIKKFVWTSSKEAFPLGDPSAYPSYDNTAKFTSPPHHRTNYHVSTTTPVPGPPPLQLLTPQPVRVNGGTPTSYSSQRVLPTACSSSRTPQAIRRDLTPLGRCTKDLTPARRDGRATPTGFSPHVKGICTRVAAEVAVCVAENRQGPTNQHTKKGGKAKNKTKRDSRTRHSKNNRDPLISHAVSATYTKIRKYATQRSGVVARCGEGGWRTCCKVFMWLTFCLLVVMVMLIVLGLLGAYV